MQIRSTQEALYIACEMERGAVQLRVAPRQPRRVALLRQALAGERREEGELCAERAQGVDVGRVEEAGGGVARDRNALAGEHGRDRRCRVRAVIQTCTCANRGAWIVPQPTCWPA